MDIYVSFLIMFIVFSSLMMATGAGETMMDIAKLIGGRFKGGAAKISVISSAMVGSMTGSSVTNVAMTGNFTIPMMKRLGYRSEIAGAIEATASSGGQITPPLMGAGLFLMAEFLNMELGAMMLIALVPATLFYAGVLASVHFESLRAGIDRLPPEEMPDAARLKNISVLAPLAVPFALLLWMILSGFSVGLSIMLACTALIILHMIAARSKDELIKRGSDILDGFAQAARPLVVLGALCAAAGLLVGVIGFVGIGVKFGDAVLGLAQGNLFAALALAGAVVMVIGMGMPTTAAYILAVSVILTAFTKLGISPLQSHMFVFYFATLSAITPPVCAAVFVAAGLAEASWWKTAIQTVRFAVIKYILPFLFVFRPETVLQGDTLSIVMVLAASLAGTIALSAAFAGWLVGPMNTILRTLTIVAGFAMFWPSLTVNLIGFICLIMIFAINGWLSKDSKVAV